MFLFPWNLTIVAMPPAAPGKTIAVKPKTIVFLYEATLKQREKVSELPRMKRPQQLPVVLSREVARILKVSYNLKHKALLMIAYSAGLRVGEVVWIFDIFKSCWDTAVLKRPNGTRM